MELDKQKPVPFCILTDIREMRIMLLREQRSLRGGYDKR